MKRKNLIKSGFTLIELLISMSIIFIILGSTYVPYNHYSKKAKLNISVKQISQNLYLSKSIAINGSTSSGSNRSIAMYLDNRDLYNNKIITFSYPYDITPSNILPIESLNIKKISEISLSKGIQIDKINSHNNALIFFNAISGLAEYYTYNPNKNNIILDGDNIILYISYMGSTGNSLKRKIIYNTKTNIIDYD